MDEKQGMAEQSRLLIDLNEPEALLESLRRECQRKADNFADGLVPPEEAIRWRTAATALTEALNAIAASQEPAGAAHEPDKPIPEPSAVPAEAAPTSPA